MRRFSNLVICETSVCHPDLRLEGPGDYDFEVVGEASYEDALEALAGGRTESQRPIFRHRPTALSQYSAGHGGSFTLDLGKRPGGGEPKPGLA